MDWRDIPSLSALRAFEAAARTGSLSAAARELNVTHAAISQHVRGLEARLDRRLLDRDGQRMVPTPDGAVLAEALGDGFGRIAAGVRDLLDRNRQRPLRVSLTPSFATNWLMPRIGAFWQAHPEIALELLPGTDLVDLRRDAVDVAIRYGRGGWPGVATEVLIAAGHTAVAAPGHVEGPVAKLADLRGVTWLLDSMMAEEDLWAREAGVDLRAEAVRIFANADLTREAARAGLGVAILPAPLLADAVADGSLTVLTAERHSPFAHHLLTRPGSDSPALRLFLDWLREAARPAPPADLPGAAPKG